MRFLISMVMEVQHFQQFVHLLPRDIEEEFTRGSADVMSGGLLLEHQWVFSVLVVVLI